MSDYLRKMAKRIDNNLCGVSVYGNGLDSGSDISAVKAVAQGYLELSANRKLGWLPPMKIGLLRWKCTACKKRYFLYNNAYKCCL